MPRANNSLPTVRQESEESWRQRLNEAYQLYQLATARYQMLREKTPENSSSARILLALAHNAESRTLAEYDRLLKIVTDVAAHDVKQETQPGPGERRKKRDGNLLNFPEISK